MGQWFEFGGALQFQVYLKKQFVCRKVRAKAVRLPRRSRIAEITSSGSGEGPSRVPGRGYSTFDWRGSQLVDMVPRRPRMK